MTVHAQAMLSPYWLFRRAVIPHLTARQTPPAPLHRWSPR